ncbi:hypothetical protein [Chitinivorax sp. B]|uniref:hypothetical protein n=1 Tax=Chitinivorax sp. B TaxID=2502235 RepID=UPI0010F51159|nr:hypothetical protein [Chitinivorax sp. B]
MGKHYRVHISVAPLGATEVRKALAAIREAWTSPHYVKKIEKNKVYFLQTSAEASFLPDENEQAFAQRVSVAIWKKVGRYVKVVIDTSDSDEVPTDCFELNEYDYRKLMRTN